MSAKIESTLDFLETNYDLEELEILYRELRELIKKEKKKKR